MSCRYLILHVKTSPLSPDVAALHDDAVAVVSVGLGVHVEGDPELGEEVGGHADPPLPGAQGAQREILVRHHRKLRLQEGIQNWKLRETCLNKEIK